ncbi:MAG: hypothetical protein AAF085_00545 [Planctomycetota bacterium]
MTIKPLASLALLLLCVQLIGCGPSHRSLPLLEAGLPLHLVVNVPDDQLADAQGTVYFSLPKDAGAYASKPLELQGDDLYAVLPTQSLVPGDRVLYYFDVYAGGEPKSLGSAQRPYITDILDRTGLMLASIDSGVEFSTAGQPVVFFLDTAGYTTTKPIVRYSPPDLSGIVEQAMVFNGKQWIAEVPANRVAPGSWSYRIEANIEDIIYANPAEPGQSLFFTVPVKR